MCAPGSRVTVRPPARVPKGTLIKAGGLERAVQRAARGTQERDAILVVLDADGACPAQLGPALVARAQGARSDRQVRVVIANNEFEAWFLAAAVSLQGVGHLRRVLTPPADPERVRDAKGWLTEHSDARYPYRPARDQEAFAHEFDLQLARCAPSFDKLWRDLCSLIEA